MIDHLGIGTQAKTQREETAGIGLDGCQMENIIGNGRFSICFSAGATIFLIHKEDATKGMLRTIS